MNKLTALEQDLLAQFEKLAAVSETSLKNSEDTSDTLRKVWENTSLRLDRIERKQAEIESFQSSLLEALNKQTAGLDALIKQVNALVAASKK